MTEHAAPGDREAFQPTRWSIVHAARGDDESARAALATLCEHYWYPVYGYLRRRGAQHEDALEWTQGLFTSLIERQDFGRADPARGRFRTYLLACLRNFVAAERARERTLKRGELATTTLDGDFAVGRFEAESPRDEDPERAFDRAWTRCLLERVVSQLAEEWDSSGKRELFAALKATVLGGETHLPYVDLAERLGTTEAALKAHAHQLRRRYREILRQEVAQTVSGGSDLEQELQALFRSVEA